ncbi:hypothetical protein VPNG_07184 [Cytospora leucostoma]|uniref:Uncharacterized protein n=1 Tax=Cytospora leucostoma TaxID=1230097 RepID=A0A423WK56_9PEZI|nr:hypothetical protein VPNG_07184 [Cytospora leucostoma]
MSTGRPQDVLKAPDILQQHERIVASVLQQHRRIPQGIRCDGVSSQLKTFRFPSAHGACSSSRMAEVAHVQDHWCQTWSGSEAARLWEDKRQEDEVAARLRP